MNTKNPQSVCDRVRRGRQCGGCSGRWVIIFIIAVFVTVRSRRGRCALCRGRCGGSSFRWVITIIIAVIVIVIIAIVNIIIAIVNTIVAIFNDIVTIVNDIVARMALRREVRGALVGLL